MGYQEIKIVDINEMCRWLEFYDKHKYLPFRKKRLNLSLTHETIDLLKKKSIKSNKPMSAIIEEGIKEW